MRLKTFNLLIVLALLLAACAPVATPTAAPAEATTVPADPATPAATSQPAATQAPAATAPAGEPAAPPAGVITYTIVPGESQVRYEVGETFINRSNAFNLAIGITTQVTGQVLIDHNNPQNSTVSVVQVDISQFKSDSSRRDNVIRNDWLESARYPIATFTPQTIEGLPGSGQEGQPYSFKISGDLTIREVTKPVTFEVSAQLNGDTLSGEAAATILMSEFGVGPISIAGILNTEDQAKLIFTFIARP